MTEERSQTKEDKATTRINNYYNDCMSWCLGPVSSQRGGAAGFWGLVLVVIGGAWLAANVLDIEDWGRWAGSLLLVGIGLWFLGRAMGRRAD